MLIAIEGIHGCGKSTLMRGLVSWFTESSLPVITTAWNSHELVHPVISSLKRKNQFQDPWVYSLTHLADFSCRYYGDVLPGLSQGTTVLADRYVYSALARDTIRGLPMHYVRQAYSFARQPDLVILLDAPADICVARRILTSNSVWRYGMGYDPIEDREFDIDGYVRYLEKYRKAYLHMCNEEGFVVVDATASPPSVLSSVKGLVESRMNFEVGTTPPSQSASDSN